MKWIRPSGKEIETNDEKATIDHCVAMKWDKAPPPIVESVPTPAEARMMAIDNAMDLVMEDNDSNLMTESGVPKVESLIAVLEYPITSAERDSAYTRWQDSPEKKG